MENSYQQPGVKEERSEEGEFGYKMITGVTLADENVLYFDCGDIT